MADRRQYWLLLPKWVRRFPRDLAIAVGVVLATALAALVPGPVGTAVQLLFGVPFVLFVPGYVLIAAIFPERRSEAPENLDRDDEPLDDRVFARVRGGLAPGERAVFAIWSSVAVVPLLGLLVNFLPWAIAPATMGVAIAAFVVPTAGIAAVRRWSVPTGERFRIEFDGSDRDFGLPASRTELALDVVLALAVLVAVASVSYAVLVPDQRQSFTEFYLLSENETGALIANDYPREFRPGQTRPLTVGIENHEGEPMNYTVVVVLQRVDDNETPTVAESNQLATFRTYVEAGGAVTRRHTIAPEMRGRGLRLQYLLYRGPPPADPNPANAYRKAHIWIDVSADGGY